MQDITLNASCGACGGTRLDEVFTLPDFPITGIFVTQPVPGPSRGFDQSLLLCADCGHAQLSRIIPPAQLYGEGYAHRSSASHLAGSASDWFVDYIGRLGRGRVFEHVLEVGCNDLVLMRKMATRARRATGIEPIWRGRTPDVPPNVAIIGKFLEEVDLASELGGRPDLIISTHNLEHIASPLDQYRRLMDVVADDALFVIEVPDSDVMVENVRFDQVFHQHVHYFGLASLCRFIDSVSGEYVDHAINPRNWGGSLSIAFRRRRGGNGKALGRRLERAPVAERYALFRRQKADLMAQLAGIEGPVWGYGGGQMVPSLAYHMESDLSFLAGIVDDNPSRDGLYYPHLAPRIVAGPNRPNLKDAAVFITAVDGTRAIAHKLRDEDVRTIVSPTAAA